MPRRRGQQAGSHGIAVLGAVGEQNIAVTEAVQHVVAGAPVMGLALGQL